MVSKTFFQQNFTPPRIILICVILIYLLFFGNYAAQRHLTFETGAFDVGVYAQPLWNYLQGRDFALTIMKDDGFVRWANHIEPILFLVLPLYSLWPDPRLLLWLQVTALSLTAIPLYALATRRLKNEWVALTIVLAYFLMPVTQSITLFDFHAVTLAPLFLLSALYFLDHALANQGHSLWLWPKPDPSRVSRLFSTRTAYILTSLFFLLALSTKEDISLHVFMIGVYLLILRRRWQEALPLMIVGLTWFYVAFEIIIPSYRVSEGQSIFTAWFETLGNTPTEVALSPITQPDKVLALIFRPDNLPPLAMLTVPMALLPWFGLPFFVLAAPSLAFSLLSNNPTTRQLETWHYATPMLPFVLLATIDGLARIQYGVTIIGQQLRLSHLPGLPRLTTGSVAAVLLIITALIYHNLRGYSPLSQLYEPLEVTDHHKLGHELAKTIPEDAAVLAQAQLLPYVAHRAEVAIWYGPLLTEYDYVWMDLSHHKLPNRFNAHGEFLTGLIIEHDFGFIVAEDGYLMLKKGASRDVMPKSLFTFTEYDTPPAGTQTFDATFGDEIKLVGVKSEIRRLATSETEPQIVLYFEVLEQPSIDYQMIVYRLDPQGNVIGATDYTQPSLFWWGTSRWEAGDKRQVRVNTIPWWTGDDERFGYALGFSSSTASNTEAPWDEAARLPITLGPQNPSDSLLIENDTLLPVAAYRRFAGLPYNQPLNTLQFTGPQVAVQE